MLEDSGCTPDEGPLVSDLDFSEFVDGLGMDDLDETSDDGAERWADRIDPNILV